MKTPNTPYHAVLFDLDGTLVDTEALCNQAGMTTLRDLGTQPDIQFFEALSGVDDATRLIKLGDHIGPAHDAAAVMNEWYLRFAAALDEGVPLKPGALDLLAQLATIGVPVALVTSSQRGHAKQKLTNSGLAPAFEVVVTVDDVTQAKPAPDPYLLGAEWLGFDPRHCLAFEDSDPGALSAQRAGMKVVQVPDGPHATGTHAHFLAPTLIAGAKLAKLIS